MRLSIPAIWCHSLREDRRQTVEVRRRIKTRIKVKADSAYTETLGAVREGKSVSGGDPPAPTLSTVGVVSAQMGNARLLEKSGPAGAVGRTDLKFPASELLGRFLRNNGKVLGLLAVPDFAKPLDREAALEQFPYCGRPARHPLRKPPRIDNPQLLRRQHDLEPLTSTEIAHLALPVNHQLL
jgi:hypothetical protein